MPLICLRLGLFKRPHLSISKVTGTVGMLTAVDKAQVTDLVIWQIGPGTVATV